MEEKPIGAEAEVNIQTPIEQAAVELPTPIIKQKPKINKFVILGVILGVLVISGTAFGAYKLGQRQLQPTPSPTPEAVATPTPDPTADWETYINSEYRYSIKYPEGLTPVDKTELWFGGEGKSGVLFEGANISVLVTDDPWDVFKKSITADFNGEILEVDIAGEKALVLEGKDLGERGEFPVKKCLIRYNDKNYQLVISGEQDFTGHLNTFNLMLSTFRFLEEEGSETFRDSQYGFELSYPLDWQVKTFSNQGGLYNAVKSGVTFTKNNYELIVVNLGKIPESGCLGSIKSMDNFKKLEVLPVALWRPKIEEGKYDGMMEINPQGTEFVWLKLGTIKDYTNEEAGSEGVTDCNFSVNNYRYEINYQFQVIGQENLRNLDREILSKMDEMVLSIKWAN